MTLKQIYQKIETLFNNTIMFQSIEYRPSYEFSRNPDIIYPAIFVEEPVNGNFSTKEASALTYAIVFSDRSLEGLENRLEIMSRLLQFTNIFMSMLNDELEFESWNTLMYEENEQDRCYSIRTEFIINYNIDYICDDFDNYIKPTC